MKLAIIIPAYNEEAVIVDVIAKLPKKLDNIDEIVSIVIDDGSTDHTYEAAKKKADFVLKHVVNLGQGAAMSTGFKLAKKLKCDIVITIDGDGQHNPKDIKNLIKPILDDRADVVNGSRMYDTSGMPTFKIFGNRVMNFITFIVFHKWVTDSQSGLRAFSKKALGKIKIYSMGHEVCSEMIGEVKRNKLKMIEIPVETIYTAHSIGKGQIWLNGINIFTRIIAIKLTSKK